MSAEDDGNSEEDPLAWESEDDEPEEGSDAEWDRLPRPMTFEERLEKRAIRKEKAAAKRRIDREKVSSDEGEALPDEPADLLEDLSDATGTPLPDLQDDFPLDEMEDFEWDSGDSDCEYEGGIHDCLPSESDEYPWTDSDGSSSEDELSDFDAEMMVELKAELASLAKPTPYSATKKLVIALNKWAMDPKKLADFSAGKLIPEAAKKYAEDVIRDEMPRGLKKYMEAELLPRLQLKVGKGISLSTPRRWLHKEGFQFIGHKKDVYFDGHDRPDVVASLKFPCPKVPRWHRCVVFTLAGLRISYNYMVPSGVYEYPFWWLRELLGPPIVWYHAGLEYKVPSPVSSMPSMSAVKCTSKKHLTFGDVHVLGLLAASAAQRVRRAHSYSKPPVDGANAGKHVPSAYARLHLTGVR
ncbi:hypothetical protein B0H10DRAFT_2225777 [Mycena sp. CBHHK59/15]|nr:hypothetical protein B0H10DRAFT_2225777 [Mycena sp. CBHHK59/15]